MILVINLLFGLVYSHAQLPPCPSGTIQTYLSSECRHLYETVIAKGPTQASACKRAKVKAQKLGSLLASTTCVDGGNKESYEIRFSTPPAGVGECDFLESSSGMNKFSIAKTANLEFSLHCSKGVDSTSRNCSNWNVDQLKVDSLGNKGLLKLISKNPQFERVLLTPLWSVGPNCKDIDFNAGGKRASLLPTECSVNIRFPSCRCYGNVCGPLEKVETREPDVNPDPHPNHNRIRPRQNSTVAP